MNCTATDPSPTPDATLRATLVYQRRAKADGPWTEDNFNLATLHAGQDVRMELHSAETLKLYRERSQRYEKEKQQIKAQAEGLTAEYNSLNVHDDQFDMAEACFSVSIALYGITALTRRSWLLAIAGIFSLFGCVFGLAGFLNWSLHPDWLAKLLS